MAAAFRELPDLAALLSASGDDALVAYEVGPELLAPPLGLGRAVLFRRETQLGFAGAAALGPVDDVAALLTSPWRQVPGWEGERSITVPAASEPTLRALGVRGVGLWTTMSLRPGEMRRRPAPDGIAVDEDLDPREARAFVDEHYSARWLAPEPAGETWVALRDGAGAVLATGLAALTPAGATRISSVTVSRDARRAGLGGAGAGPDRCRAVPLVRRHPGRRRGQPGGDGSLSRHGLSGGSCLGQRRSPSTPAPPAETSLTRRL